MQGNPPRELSVSPESTADIEPLIAFNGHLVSRDILDPEKDVEQIPLSPSCRRHSSFECPAPTKSVGGFRRDTICSENEKESPTDVVRLNVLLQSSINRLANMENEKHDRYEKWKHEAIEHGMKLVEAERKRSDEEHAVLLKRIAFLTEELEETRRQLRAKSRECEEMAELAEHLSANYEGANNTLNTCTSPTTISSAAVLARAAGASFNSPPGRTLWLAQKPLSSESPPASSYASPASTAATATSSTTLPPAGAAASTPRAASLSSPAAAARGAPTPAAEAAAAAAALPPWLQRLEGTHAFEWAKGMSVVCRGAWSKVAQAVPTPAPSPSPSPRRW